MNANINTYISARYNIEICKSGENGEEVSRFPFGTGMKKNMILDSWLETIPFMLNTPCSTSDLTCFNPGPGGNRNIIMSQMTNGFMQIGKGTTPTNPSQRKLISFSKETDYIRPFSNSAGFTNNVGLGMRTYSKTYEFSPETSPNTYYEAGFRSELSSLWDNNYRISGLSQALPSALRSPIFSRFVFTQPSGLVGFVSGFKDELNNLSIFSSESGASGYIIDNQLYYSDSGSNFSELSERNDFQYGWQIYSPLFNGITGGFSGINGELTGSGIITGIIGYKNDLSGISVLPGEYIKIKYDVSIRIPAIVEAIPITGQNLVYGDFNGSGNVKLLGQFQNLFGPIDFNGYYYTNPGTTGLPSESNLRFNYGIMWSINTSRQNNSFSVANSHFTAAFVSGINSTSSIIGFLSGYKNENDQFSGLHLIDINSGSSGYFWQNNIYYFPTGSSFSGFSGQSGFIENNYITSLFTGFSFPRGSGFSGIEFIDSGYGVMTGIIGSRTELIPRNFPSADTNPNMALISYEDGPTSRKQPLAYNGTAFDFYNSGQQFKISRSHYIDREFRFIANYPSNDLDFGGVFFTYSTSNFLNGMVSDSEPSSSIGWYWKFDKIQRKYTDQLMSVNFRFGVYRD